MREIRRRTRVVGAFPDGTSALMLVAARLRHVAATSWGSKRYLDMNLFKEKLAAGGARGRLTNFFLPPRGRGTTKEEQFTPQPPEQKCEKFWTLPCKKITLFPPHFISQKSPLSLVTGKK